jgi:hypothetical protein
LTSIRTFARDTRDRERARLALNVTAQQKRWGWSVVDDFFNGRDRAYASHSENGILVVQQRHRINTVRVISFMMVFAVNYGDCGKLVGDIVEFLGV